jgi:hypothetical protein
LRKPWLLVSRARSAMSRTINASSADDRAQMSSSVLSIVVGANPPDGDALFKDVQIRDIQAGARAEGLC